MGCGWKYQRLSAPGAISIWISLPRTDRPAFDCFFSCCLSGLAPLCLQFLLPKIADHWFSDFARIGVQSIWRRPPALARSHSFENIHRFFFLISRNHRAKSIAGSARCLVVYYPLAVCNGSEQWLFVGACWIFYWPLFLFELAVVQPCRQIKRRSTRRLKAVERGQYQRSAMVPIMMAEQQPIAFRIAP